MQLASSPHRRRNHRRYYREGPTEDLGLGNLWTKIRDKVIKPVGRVVAAYYTVGASEIAFQAYDKANAQKKAAAAQAAYEKSVGVGTQTLPPVYPPPGSPGAQAFMASGTNMLPPRPPQQTPEWLLPAAAGIGGLLLVKLVLSKR